MRVVVLGAGASHGASANAGASCPLVGGFFATAKKLGLLDAEFGRDFWSTMRQQGITPETFQRIYPSWELEGTEHLQVLKDRIL